MNEVFQTQLQNAIDLLVKSSAYETPLSDDVIERIGKSVAAAGFTPTVSWGNPTLANFIFSSTDVSGYPFTIKKV